MKCITCSSACRTAATAAVLLLGAAMLPQLAGASGVGGRTAGIESVSSATWGATVSVTSMTFTGSGSQLSNVTNTGSVDLIAESFVVTVSQPASGAPTFKVFTCPVAWIANKCSGTTGVQVGLALDANSTNVITSSVTLAVGGVEYLRVRGATVSSATTVSISSQIAGPSQLRAAIKSMQ
jgi:hypothetical protein